MRGTPAIPVAIIGGGVHVAALAEVVASRRSLPALELRVFARDRERLEAVVSHTEARLRATGAAHRAVASRDLDDALDSAAAVVLLVRVGGLAARAHDETFPFRAGLVGDEGIGVGGMANAWRTIPVLDAIAARIAAIAPAARVLNLMAPLGVTTRLLVERGLDTVGLCELPSATLSRWRALAGDVIAPELAYAGLNHLGFFWPPGSPAEEHPIVRAAVAAGELPAELVARLESGPLHYYMEVFEADAARLVGRQRRPGRAGELAGVQAELLARFRERPGAASPDPPLRSTPWFEQALAPALDATLGGPAYADTLNLTGAGILDEAPADVVVEVRGTLDRDRACLHAVPPRPAPVRALIARLAAAEDATYRAAARRDRALLAGALDLLPAERPLGAAARAELLADMCRPLDSISDQVSS
jgi:6-phospho-beta-glucosidase